MPTKTSYNRIDDIVINSAERVRNSGYGNPTWRLTTSMGTFLTQKDGAIGYAIENFTNSRFPETFVIGNPAGPKVTLVLGGVGNRVVGIERDGKHVG